MDGWVNAPLHSLTYANIPCYLDWINSIFAAAGTKVSEGGKKEANSEVTGQKTRGSKQSDESAEGKYTIAEDSENS